MCPVCQNNLVPVVYGHVTDQHLRWNNEGKIILMGYRDRYKESPNSYCLACDEGFLEWAVMPDYDAS